MAKYDKYDPISGGFRALLGADLVLTNGEVGPVAVSLNASGGVVVGTAGQSGIVGVLVKNVARGPVGPWGTSLIGTANPDAPIGARTGDAVDVMTSGEIVDLDTTAFPAGSKIYATAATGVLSTTGGTGKHLVGYTVKAGRLIVRVSANQVAQP
jgi:hypothetical protein